MGYGETEKKIVDVQLQEGQVGVAVIGLVLALLGDIFLEGRGDLGVVSVEAVEDGLDVFRPVGRVVEGNHGCDVREERPLNKPAATLSSNLSRRTSATSSLGTSKRADIVLPQSTNPEVGCSQKYEYM